MTSLIPLTGTELIDCARANYSAGLELAAKRCGYKGDLKAFESQLKQDCDHMGINIGSFQDLVLMEHKIAQSGMEIAPDTKTEL